MTEDQAQDWLKTECGVSRETFSKLQYLTDLILHEAREQNLIAASTMSAIWLRHIVDSAQLIRYAPQETSGRWLDLGSGAGFPGLVIAIISDWPVTLVESRRLRIEFLTRLISELGLEDKVSVEGKPVERVTTAPFSVISARAFAPLLRLFDLAVRFSTDKTLWLLPKGRNAAKEWTEAQQHWRGDFRIEQSITDAEAGIMVGHLAGRRGIKAGKGHRGGRT